MVGHSAEWLVAELAVRTVVKKAELWAVSTADV